MSISSVSPISTVEGLLAAARAAGLDVTTTAALDRSGLDFLVVHGRDAEGTPWIVRTPRRPEVAAAASVEARVLSLVRGPLAGLASVEVPHWRFHSAEVIAYPRLPGTPAISLDTGAPVWNVDPADPGEAFLDSLARALVALQSIPAEAASLAELPIKPLDEQRASYARSIEATRAALGASEAVISRWQAWLASGPWPEHLALVHGDLHPGHLLIDARGALTGILDWTEGHLGDPSTDLAMCYGCFGPAVFERLLARFAQHGGATWPRLAEHAAERWAFFPVLVAEWALRTGNEGALDHARGHLPKE
jgi:aminoglycoside phosphotransferase (APT) family kinase protein